MWTLAILLLYFALTNINIFGLSPESQDIFGLWRALLAGASGSLLHLGIGPIVTASIVLQLLKGADILRIDTSEARGQVMYMGLQKMLIFVMIIVEALPMVASGLMCRPTVAAQLRRKPVHRLALIFLGLPWRTSGGADGRGRHQVGSAPGVGLFIVRSLRSRERVLNWLGHRSFPSGS